MTVRTLTRSAGAFDRATTFRIALPNDRRVPMTCKLHCGYDKKDDGVFWALQCGGVLASSYSAEEVAERDRLAAETPLRHGDEVEIEGACYRVRVLGDYSDAAIFDRI